MISTLILAVALCLPAQAQEPETAQLEAQLQELSLQVQEQNAELERLREQVSQSTVPVVQEEHIEIDAAELVAGPERVSFGGSVMVDAGEVVTEAVSFGGDVEIAGHVTGDATAFGGSVSVVDGGMVDGDAISFGGSVQVDPGGVVAGDRVGMGSPPAAKQAQQGAASVHGVGRGLLSSLYHRAVFLLSFLGAGVLMVGLFPERVGRVAQALEARPLRSLLVGTFASIALMLAAVIFAITLLGIPITVLILGLLGLSWLVGFVGLCQALGDRLPIFSQPAGRWVTFLVGALVVSFVGVLPFVGWLVVAGASMLGMGAALTSRFGSASRG